jgi:hypothetical protein
MSNSLKTYRYPFEEVWRSTLFPASLPEEAFGRLCLALLEAQGFVLVDEPRTADVGVDFVMRGTDGDSVVIECKAFREPPRLSQMMQLVAQLERAREYLGTDRALLLVSHHLAPQLRIRFGKPRPWLSFLDSSDLQRAYEAFPDLLRRAEEVARAEDAKFWATNTERRNASAIRNPRGRELLMRLANLVPGREDSERYEALVVDILNFAFGDALGVPKLQSRSDDGLDIRDAIFPIGRSNAFWAETRLHYQTRFLVVECKNHAEPPGQREVESLQQYLTTVAMRTFGFLCARHLPSQSALLARRRAWVESRKLILFLSDEELAELIHLREHGSDREALIEALLDEFFSGLVP